MSDGRPAHVPVGQFVGEPVDAVADSIETASMVRGEPGVPMRFVWRGQPVEVKAVMARWKSYSPCKTSHSPERYVRRHWANVETADGRRMTLYLDRQAGGRGEKRRWWLFDLSDSGNR